LVTTRRASSLADISGRWSADWENAVDPIRMIESATPMGLNACLI